MAEEAPASKEPPKDSEPALPPLLRDDLPLGDNPCFSDFGVEILILASRLSRTRAGRHTADQLLRCGTMLGARMQETVIAESDEELSHILKAARKDIRESAYWLRLIRKAKLLEAGYVESLETKCRDLTNIVTSQVLSLKAKHLA